MNGYFNIKKPTGMSSAAVVAILRRLTGVKRIGHAGTLDPEAAGVLPVMTGKATRLFDYLTDKEKEYIAICAFGAATDTQDATGTVIERGEHYPDRDTFLAAAEQMTGEITQIPSMYSAIKVGGEPLYLRARRGETIDVPQRVVHIEEIKLIRETPDHGFEIRIRCGKGTYIRTLCADLGRLCGCPAHMRSLVRIRSGVFRIEDAMTLEEADELASKRKLAERLLPPDYPLKHLPRADIPAEMSKFVINGAKIPMFPGIEGLNNNAPVRIYLEGCFWGIVTRRNDELIWKAQIAPENVPEEMG